MPQKFQLGDVVDCDFSGVVEEIKVVVRKRLFVRSAHVVSDTTGAGHHFVYDVCERNPIALLPDHIGKAYRKDERDLIELEPVVQEIEKVKPVMQKQLTGFQLDPQIIEALRAASEAQQNWNGSGLDDALANSSDPSSRALRSKCC